MAVSQATASASATRATVKCCSTRASNAHRTAALVSFAFGSAAALVPCLHTRRQLRHRYRRTVTASVVGRHPNGSCASRRTTVSRTVPSHPQRRHHRSPGSASTTWQARTARSGSSRCPVTSNPKLSSRQKVVRSGHAKVASSMSGSSWTVA